MQNDNDKLIIVNEVQEESLIIRFNFVQCLLEYVYEKNGYKSIPFDIIHREALINECSRDIYYLLMHVLKSAKDAHKALDLLKKSYGNVHLFYLLLNLNEQSKFKSFCLFDYVNLCQHKL